LKTWVISKILKILENSRELQYLRPHFPWQVLFARVHGKKLTIFPCQSQRAALIVPKLILPAFVCTGHQGNLTSVHARMLLAWFWQKKKNKKKLVKRNLSGITCSSWRDLHLLYVASNII
jgi:hypothetical protein